MTYGLPMRLEAHCQRCVNLQDHIYRTDPKRILGLSAQLDKLSLICVNSQNLFMVIVTIIKFKRKIYIYIYI